MIYDYIIVGAGIAGLYTGLQLLKKHPHKNILILESYNYIGGRIVTYHKDGHQWEIGAGRISMRHGRLLKLMDTYHLHLTPISGNSTLFLDKESYPGEFDDLIRTYLEPLTTLPLHTLYQHTIASLLEMIHGSKKIKEFFLMFPYWAEFHTQRADIALESFFSEFSKKAHYCSVREGFQAVPKAVAADFMKRGGHIQFNTTVKDVEEKGDTVLVHCSKDSSLEANRVILALHSEALQKIPFAATHMPALKHLTMEPLVRMYAVFPLVNGKAWFPMTKLVTGDPVRYIIPVGKDTIMISYTEGPYARHWIDLQKRKGDAFVQREVMKHIRALFPDLHIPNPLLFKIHPWTSGCTYWTPGIYDVRKMSDEAHQLTDRVFACGESISLRQAWVEGALESAETLLKLLK
jgi:monoamine oxidase